MSKLCVAVIGATGLVGQTFLKVLAEKNEDFELKPHAMFSLARVYETQGKTEQAISEYKNIVNTYSDSNWADLATSRLIVIDNSEISK